MEIQTYCEFVAEDSQLDAVSGGKWEAMRGQQSALYAWFHVSPCFASKKKRLSMFVGRVSRGHLKAYN